MNEKQKSLAFRVLMALLSFVFLLLFARSSSPLTPRENGWDAAFFRLVGQRMTEGYLPYRDFFDMKGPYLFLLEYLGQLIVRGRLGAFILEWINLTVSLLIVCRIFDRLHVRKYWVRFLLLLPSLWIAIGTFEGGNMTEELSLPVLFLCLDLWLKRFLDPGSSGTHAPKYAAVYGAGFMYLALIRITNAALIGAIVLAICIELILHRNFRCLGMNALAFIAGSILVFLPMYVFFAANGLAGEMLYQVFVFGYKYGSEYGFLSSLLRALRHPQLYIFLLLPVIMLPVFRVRDLRLILMAVFASCFTLYACIPSNQYNHYFVLGIPLIVLSEIIMLLPAEETPRKEKRNRLAVILMALCMLLYVRTSGGSVLHSFRAVFVPGFSTTEGIQDIASHIDEDEKDRVFSYNVGAFWYVYADLNPYIKYCGWHRHYIKLDPQIASEIEALIKEDPPACIVVPARKAHLPSYMKKILKKGYSEAYRNEQYILYRKKAVPVS